MPIYFYVPSSGIVRNAPASCSHYWGWIRGAVEASPAPLGNGLGPCRWLGPYNWTIQTYMYLRESDFECTLTATLPDEGIIVTHGDFLTPSLASSRRRFIVEIKPDRAMQSAFANFLVVQNEHDPVRRLPMRYLVSSAAVPYWPQPGLIPRDASRGGLFQNIGFAGRPENFLSESRELAEQLAAIGLTCMVVPVERWHDYGELDAIVAVRPPENRRDRNAVPFFSTNRKPASKLVNAWIAGVPAILSPDDAFRQLRRSPLDYLEARTVPDIVAAVRQLQRDPALRTAMEHHGRLRAAEFRPERIARVWADILQNDVRPAFDSWSRSPVRRQWFYLSRRAAHAVRWRVQRWRAVREQKDSPR